MADYIKRSDLIQKAEHEAESMSEPYKSTLPPLVDWLSAKVVPIDDVAPLKRGEWIVDDPIQFITHCSNCKWTNVYYAWNYCPNCGSDMRGGI